MNDDNNNDVNNKFPHLTPLQAHVAEKAVEKLSYVKALRKLKGDNKWTILEELVQEIQADYTASGTPMPTAKFIIELTKKKIEERYSLEDEETKELKELLLNSIPNPQTITAWYRREGWNQAVWDKIKTDGLFSKERRAAMIHALYKRGIEKDTVAAKLYLTMSGDYSDRPPDEKNATAEQFKEINKILHKKA